MNITKNTTEAELLVPVERARQRLSDLATKPLEGYPTPVETLTDAMHDVWRTEAVARFQWQVVSLLQQYGDVALERDRALTKLFVRTLSSPTGDTYSGRKNDARRCADDAVRAWISDVQFSLVSQ